ncbi:MAG: acyl-CoA carboxylase subunit beta [Acidimicrobiales bacterium]
MSLHLRSLSGPLTTVTTTDLDGRTAVLAVLRPDDERSTLTVADAATLADAVRSARRQRVPFVAVLRTSGVAVEEGIAVADGWGRVARELVLASGVIPVLLVADGPVVSGPALLLALADVVIFTERAYAFVTGPHVVETYTGQPISASDLGGSGAHARSTGVASIVVASLDDAFDAVGAVLGHLPDNVDEMPPTLPTDDPSDRPTPEAGELVPATASGSYDVREVIRIVADDGEFLELRPAWAPNLVTGFAFVGGHSVGIVANQTQALAGAIDIPGAQKGARFVAMCDAFNVPLLTMVDTSGFLPGKDLEWRGMIRHGAQLAFAYARATVPRIALILRKSYGGAYIVMDSRYMGNDLMLAWPTAEVAVMGAKGAVEILHRRSSEDDRRRLEADYETRFLTPYAAAERASISAVITPEQTRGEITAALDLLTTKHERLRPRRHDNTPL